MSSYKDLVKKVNDEKKSAVPAVKQGQSTDYRDLVKKVNDGTIRVGSKLNGSQVDEWVSGQSSVMKRAYDFLSKDGYKKSDKSLERDIDTYLSQARDVAQYLRANRFEIENYDEIMQSYHDTVSNLRRFQSAVNNTTKFYSQFKTEDDYQKWDAQQKDYEKKLNLDLDAAAKEIEDLKAQREDYAQNHEFDWNDHSQRAAHEQYLKDLDMQISQKNAFMNQAKNVQNEVSLTEEAEGAADFSSASQYAGTRSDDFWSKLTSQYGMGYDDLTYEYINNQNGIRDEIKQKQRSYSSDSPFSDGESTFEEKGYDYLTENEIAIYNYYYAKNGKEKAQEYLDSIQETLNMRKAAPMYQNMENNTLLELAFGVAAGLDQWESGMKNLINTEDDYIPASATQMASGMVRENLGDSGFNFWYNFKDKEWKGTVLGNSVGQVAYDAITTSANMAPSIMTSWALSMVNPVAGSMWVKAGQVAGNAMMGASAMGNAYQEALNAGYDKGQARAYSALVGGSEVGLQYLLGGIGELGGTLSGNAIEKIMNGVDSAFARTAIKLGGNMLSEGMEEGLQEILTPWFKNLTMHTNEDINWNDVAYSTLLGALTAGFMEGPQTIYGEVNNYRTGRSLQNAGVSAQRLAEIGATFSADTVAHQLAGRVNENTGAYTMGRLFNEIGAEITEANKADIQRHLEMSGMPKEMAKENAEIFARIVTGADVSDSQAAVLEANEVLAQAVMDGIIEPNSTEYQRSKGYNDVLMALAKEKASPKGSRTNPAKQGEENTPTPDNVDVQNESGTQGDAEPSVEGKTFLKSSPDETVSVREVVDTKDGNMTLRLEDGRTVDAEDVSFGTEGEALVYETVAQMGASVNAANILIKGFKAVQGDSLSASVYAHGIDEAFRYGKLGIPFRELQNSSFASKLNPGQQEYVYRQGKKAAGKQVAKEQATVNKTYNKAMAVVASEKSSLVGKEKAGSYHAVLDDGIPALSLNESQRASYNLADQIAQAAKVNIVVYVGKTGERGYYKPSTDQIFLNLNATNKSRQSMMAFALGHELVHRAKKGSPGKYQAFTEFLMKEYGKSDTTVEAMIAEQLKAAEDHDIEMTEEKAFEEVVCDACQRMLLDTDAGQRLAEFGAQSKENKSFLEDLKRWITEFMDKLRSIFKGVEPDSMAAKEFAKFDENVKQILADMYVDMVIDAGEKLSTIQNAFGKGTVVEANEQGEFTMASSEDGSEKLFNLATWNNGGRETLEATLLREGYTEDEVKAALTIMDEKHRLVSKIAKELDDSGKMAFPEQGRINEATLTTDLKDGHAVLSALVSNGDYPVNIDLLMVCKKRKAYQRVINRLCETGMIQQATVDALAIAEINKILGKYGFETACLGCFVESRRLRIQEWAQTIVKEWNAEVKKRNPNAKAFGFGKGEATLTPDEVMQLIGELESGGEKNDQGNLNLGQGSAVKRMGVLLDKVPTLRRTLSVEDLITPDGLSSLRQFDSNLFSMVKSRYGSNSPKFVQEFNPYNHELAKYGKVPSEYDSLREYLYAIGGARMQSFSDFIVENWFDYCQIVADLAARKLPMHTYTKEISLARLFGLTGIKINMSLIPDVDRSLSKEYAGLTRNAKGELELIWADKDRFKATGGKSYMQSINFADAMELQNDPRYSANVGTIAVGISDMHIRMMLNDPRIRMVIPYHSSGMNPIFADLMGTSYYKDYTLFQNTTVKQLYNSKGQPVSLKLDKTQVGKLTGGFLFNEVLQELGDARAAAEAYKEWCADASKHTITIKGETYTAELTPKFDDFKDETNYYKLLEDFNTYDCITEQAAPQGDVQQIYPDGFEDILRKELSAQEGHRQKQEKNQAFDKAMDEIEGYLKNHTKADTVHYANQHGIKLSAKDKKLSAEDKARLKKLQEDGVSFMLPKGDSSSYQEPAYQEWDVQAALYDAMDHADKGYENMIRVGEMPRYITDTIGIEGDFYIYRNHAYENMVSKEQAIKDGRPVIRKGETVHFHDLGVDRMTEAIMSLENPTMTIATKTKEGNPAVIMLLPVKGKNKAPLYAVLSFYSNRHINGDLSRRPHVVLTIAEREYFGSKGRGGYAEIVGNAVRDGRVIDFNKKMRDDLSVIANPAGVGNITDSSLKDNLARFLKEIKSFREKNNIDYKLPVGEDTSPRALLSNAFESIITNPIEKRKLEEYKGNVAMLNAEEAKLQDLRAQIKALYQAKGKRDTKRIKELQFEANHTANRIATLDKMLLRFEASAPLQNILTREKKMAYERAEQKTREAIADYRKRSEEKQKQMAERYQESRKRGVENRHKAAMRQKIRKVIRDLDKILNRGDKKRNVKEDMKDFVADALASAEILFTDSYSNEDMVRDGVSTDMTPEEAKLMSEAKSILEELSNLPTGYENWQARVELENKLKGKLAYRMGKLKDVFVRERSRINKTQVSEVLGNLADSYAKLQTSEYAYVQGAFHENVYQYLLMLKEDVGGTIIKDMSLNQLEELYKAYTMVMTTVRNANRMFAENLKDTRDSLANRVMFEVHEAGGEHGMWTKAGDKLNTFSWNNEKPVYAFERIGSKTLKTLYGNIRKGQDTWAVDMQEANAFRRSMYEKYDRKSWDMDKQYKFSSSSGIDFNLNLEQMMSLYAYSKRAQAHDHLLKGGFVFDGNTEVVVNKHGLKITYLNKTATSHNVSFEILENIISKLTDEQKAFVDEMQDYLSTTMGDKGNQISMELYGVTLFNEQNYFPLRSAGQYMEKAKEADLKKEQGQVNIVNAGFAKATTPKASNPVVLSGFMDVWADHVNEMSMYHSFVLPMEDFRRVYNYSSPNMEGQMSASVNGVIQNAYGDAAVAYIDQLYRDLNGGAITDSREDLARSLTSKFKKAAVLASASVVIQQPSAIGRAFALVAPKYFIGPRVDRKRHKLLWAEVKKYAPVAFVKEMGQFDTGMGRGAVEFLQAEEYSGWPEVTAAFFKDSDYRDEVLGLLAGKADEYTWSWIWESVKRETSDKHPKMDVMSEEFLKLAGERFSEVIDKTQVYDSVLARSANMRSKNIFMNMWTAFMAEPTTSINMFEDAWRKGRKGDKKYAASTIGAVFTSVLLNSLLVSIVYAARDDDEDETYWEKYIQSFTAEMIDGINPLTYYPLLKDIWSVFQGYDIERSDMSLITDLVKSMQKLVDVFGDDSGEDADKASAAWDVVVKITAFTGIPLKNITRYFTSGKNLKETLGRGGTSWGSLLESAMNSAKDVIPVVGWTPKDTKADKLYNALLRGDTVYVERLKSGYEDEDDFHSAVKSAIKKDYLSGKIDKKTARDHLMKYAGEKVDETYWTLKEWDHSTTSQDEGEYKKYEPFYEAVLSGNNLDAVIKEYTDNGVEIERLSSQLSEYFRKQYLEATTDAEREKIADAVIEAKVAMGTYRSKAEELIEEWDFAVAHDGESYEDMIKAYKKKEISREEIVSYMQEVGKTEKEIESSLVEYDIYRNYGINYSERELAYKDGRITESDLREIYAMKNYKPEDIEALVEAHNWLKQRPQYNDVYASKVKSYLAPIENLGYNLEDAGISLDLYLEYTERAADCTGVDEDGDGKTDSNSIKNQKMDVIDSMALTSEQKDAMYYANGWAKRKLKQAPWH